MGFTIFRLIENVRKSKENRNKIGVLKYSF